jgi:hypothetical protein
MRSPMMTLGTYSQAVTGDKMSAQSALAACMGIGTTVGESVAT